MTTVRVFAAAIVCLANSLGCASAQNDALLSGPDYLAAAAARGASSGSASSVLTAQTSPERYADIAGTVTGAISSGGRKSAMITGGTDAYLVSVEGGGLPIGAEVRVLARVVYEEHRASLDLVSWAYAWDVAQAAAAVKTRGISSRKTGSTVSRGGVNARFDHTAYFDQYARAVARFNPRLTHAEVQAITRSLLDTSRETDTDPRLIMAVILAESGFKPEATSPKGAMGLGQLMPGTARGMGLSDPYDVSQNVEACIRIIRSGLNKYSGNASWGKLNWNHLRLALASYNAGSGAVRKYGGVPPYRETRNYIAKVTSYYKQLSGIK